MAKSIAGYRLPRRVVLALTLCAATAGAFAEELDLVEIVRNPVIGNYKGYAEFKMAHYDTARTIWQALAERGNAEASFNLGILYEDGLGVVQNMPAAIGHYERSGSAGSRKAQYRLGLLYAVGGKVTADAAKARQWLGIAAAQGDADAAALLARMTGAEGSQREQDFQAAETLHGAGKYQDAAPLFRQLAQQGDMRARSRLAWMLEAGQGVPRNLEEAAVLFRQAAEQGDADAQYALAVMLKTGNGQAPDATEAERWLRRAAAQGHAPADAALRAAAPG